jgi:anaerobic selenocysteine-containing dehydrogenase
MTGNTTIPGGSEGGTMWNTPTAMGMPIPSGPGFGGKPGDYWAPAVMMTSKWAEAILLREPYEKKEITEEEYRHAIGCAADLPLPNIHMFWGHGNDLNNYHDINKRIRAIKKVDFTYGYAGDFTQPTMWFYDIVLPRPYYALETMEFANFEAYELFGPGTRFATPVCNSNKNKFHYMQRPLVNPPGEVRPILWSFIQIGKALGIADKFEYADFANVSLANWNDMVEEYHKKAYEAWAARDDVKAILGHAPPSWEEFQKKPVIQWPDTKPHYAYRDTLEKGGNPFEASPSHKIEFYSTKAATTDVPNSRYGGFYDPLHRWQPPHDLQPPEQTFYDPRAVDYPLLVDSPVTPFRQHSRGDSNPLLNDCYRHAVWMSVADAKARGIKDGDLVRVYSLQGEMILPAYVTSRETPGNVAVHHGAWYRPAELKTTLDPYGIDMRGAPNILLHDIHRNDVKTPIIIHGIVQVEKYSSVVR